MQGRVELGGGAPQRRGLARLLSEATGIEMLKSASVQKSDWASSLTEKQLMYAAADAWAGKAIFERCAELDGKTFGYDAVLATLQQHERGCSHLYAYRCARQAARSALRSVELLPNLMGDAAADEAESTRLKRKSLRKLEDAQRDVSKALAPSTAAELPVARVLEDNAWVGPPREL